MATITTDELGGRIAEILPETTRLRHDLHRYPELGYDEHRTSERVQAVLADAGVEHLAGVAGGTGVLGFLPATTDPGAAGTVALRADMDALPIVEETNAPYASERPGIMHACGHDGHTAILAGTARVLAATPGRPNNVMLLFQPAEEGGAGADRMCADGALDGSRIGRPVDVVYGLHGWPGMEVGRVATRPGPLLAATDEFAITIHGKGGHAAYPHLCVDPVVVAAHIVTALQSIPSRRVGPIDNVIVTVASIHAGAACNVIMDRVEMLGTIRTLSAETRAFVEEEFRRVVHGVAEAMGATASIEWRGGYPVTHNDPAATERFLEIARSVLPEECVFGDADPTMGGEDFAFYAQHVPGCFFMIGLRPPRAGDAPSLHTPRFNFNDDALGIGIDLMCRLALDPGGPSRRER